MSSLQTPFGRSGFLVCRCLLQSNGHPRSSLLKTSTLCQKPFRMCRNGWIGLPLLLNHRTTIEYQEAVRKAGVEHGQSGLSATEQEIRGAVRKARYDMRTAKGLAQRWQTRTLTWSNSYHWQRELLNAYWDGSLHARLGEVASADTMCRTPSFAVSSTTKQTVRQ